MHETYSSKFVEDDHKNLLESTMPPNTKIEPTARSCHWVVQHVPQSPDEHNLMSISANSNF